MFFSRSKSTHRDSHFRIRRAVFGHLQYSGSTRQGTLSEYIAVPADECSKVPDGISLTTAAAAPSEALTAVQGLRKTGALEGKHVLVVAVRCPQHRS